MPQKVNNLAANQKSPHKVIIFPHNNLLPPIDNIRLKTNDVPPKKW